MALIVPTLFCASLLMAVPLRAAEQRTLSYAQALVLLSQVSDARKASEADLTRSEEETRAARFLALPSVVVNTTEVFGVKSGSLDTPMGDLRFSQNLQGPRASVDSTWSIYSGGRIGATQRALDAAVRAANADLSHTEEDLQLLLAQTYFGLELAINVEHTRHAVLEQAERQLNRALQFEHQGLIPQVERMSAQVSRDEANREEISAQRDREIAGANLQRLLHRNDAVVTSTPLFVSTRTLNPLSEWLTHAEDTSPALVALRARRDAAEQGVASAKSLWKPQVFAFGSYNFIHKYQSLTEPDWVAGIGVNFTLFAHEDRASEVSAARAGVREAQSLADAASTAIATEVETAYRKVEQAREQFGLLDSTISLAQENLRLRERGFEEGQATSLDVSDARNALARAQTERALSAYDYDVAIAQLLRSVGQGASLPDFIQHADIQLPP